MYPIRLAPLLLMVSLLTCRLDAAPLTDAEIPPPLKPWKAWVTWTHPERDCPFLSTGSVRQCVWADELTLDLTRKGGRFTYRVSAFADSQVVLPGNSEHWPTALRLDEAPATLLEQAGRPAIRLAPGSYTLSGDFAWDRLPDTLAIPQAAGIVRLSIDGTRVDHPQLKDGTLWLKPQGGTESRRTPEESLGLHVYRLLDDGHPFSVESDLELQIAGAQREISLGKPLLDGFIPSRIDSPLPARLEADGELRIQARPGTWRVRVSGRRMTPVTRLQPLQQVAPWPGEEIWVFRAHHELRVVDLSGPPQIDPRQVDLPENWANLPAYLVKAGDTLTLTQLRRANQVPEPDRLQLQRNIWLDFDGKGYTLQDRISGSMNSSWRLTIEPPLQLGRATLNGVPQLITHLPGSSKAGVEVRRGDLDLSADIRLDAGQRRLPAGGWGRNFNQINDVLHLPPGWRLLAAGGVDNVPDSWLQQWTLYDLFLVLITAIAVSRLWDWRWGLLTLLTLAVTWQEPLAPQMVWLYLLAAIALSRVAPAGKAQLLLRWLRNAGYLALVLILVPFSVQQARLGLHPQLERYSLATPYTYQTAEVQRSPPAAPPVSSIDSLSLGESKSLSGAAGKPAPLGKSAMIQQRALDEFDPNAVVQTGPGLPAWQWTRVDLSWNGPVSAGQTLDLYLLSPWQSSLLRFLSIGLVLVTAWRLLGREKTPGLRLPRLGQLMLLALALPLGGAYSGKALAEMPDPQLLGELERRLNLPPECLPDCASIQQMALNVERNAYRAVLTLHADAPVGIPLPVDMARVTPLRVTLGNLATPELVRMKNQLWLHAPKGITQVTLEAGLPPGAQAQIPLPLKPHHVTVHADGWHVEGLDGDRVPGSQITLSRLQEAAATGTPEAAASFSTASALPPFFRLQRTLHLGNDWSVTNRLVRETPDNVPATLHIPLLEGESVLSEGISVSDHSAAITLTAGQRELSWRSRLAIGAHIELKAPETDQWIEQWQVDLGPVWHLALDGIPPVHQQDADGSRLPTWQPWPGESVDLTVTRPEAVEGSSVTLDQSSLDIHPGKRVGEYTLNFNIRASRGGQHRIRLPQDAEIESIEIDGRRLTLRAEKGQLALPVAPGVQRCEIVWRQPAGMGTLWKSAALSLGGGSVNASILVEPPQDRWILWTDGPRMGPAILFWSQLIVVLLAALILGRSTSAFLPLSTLSWFLLGIGLTQVSLSSGMGVVAWFLLLHYRSGLDAEAHPKRFNLVQIGVVVLTLAFISILFWSVQQGLLGYPSMQIEGNESSAASLHWYQDRIGEAYPRVGIVSVPLLVYRGLMLLWALWLAFSLLSWLKWGWAAFSKGGIYWKAIKIDLGLQKPVRPRQRSAPGATIKEEKPE